MRKNKDEEKLQKLGLDSNIKVAEGICPTCGQALSDSLLASHIHFTPMRIDENIAYLDAQQKMIEAFVSNLREVILDKETRYSSLESAIQTNRQRIRALKKDLSSDDRLPSEADIEKRIIVERELNLLYRLRNELDELIVQLYSVSASYKQVKIDEAKLNGEYLSAADRDKLLTFEANFKNMLSKFGYTSKPVETIRISPDKYTPVYEVKHDNGIARQVDIRFESSASDFIRSQWAYYAALMKTSVSKGGNHLGVLLFDEPQQQSASTGSLKAFLEELNRFSNEQVIVLASFQNSADDYKEATEGVSNAYVIDMAKKDEMVIKRLNR